VFRFLGSAGATAMRTLDQRCVILGDSISDSAVEVEVDGEIVSENLGGDSLFRIGT